MICDDLSVLGRIGHMDNMIIDDLVALDIAPSTILC